MDPETLGMDYPEIGVIQQLLDQRLYHDVYLRIEEFLGNSEPKSLPCLEYLENLLIPENVDMFNREALGFNIYCMEFSTLCIKIAKCKKAINPGNAIKFLERGLDFIQTMHGEAQAGQSVVEKTHSEFMEAELVLKTNQAILKFENEIKDEAKTILKEGEDYMESKKKRFQSADSELYRQHYLLALNYHRKQEDAGKFLEAALHYLSYQSRNELDAKIQMGLARDITHAAIFSEDTFNFGKVLFHPIMQCLEGTEHEDLLHLLRAFDDGNMDSFEQYRHCLEKGTPLTDWQRKLLQQKMRLMCLMVMCWKLDPNQRCVTFRTIARCCKVQEDKVEIALMKAMSKGLIEGQIDQVHQCVTVTKVQPRDIDVNGVAQLLSKVDTWMGQVETISDFVENFQVEN